MSKSPKQIYFQIKNNPIWRRKIVAWMMLVLTTTQPVIASAEVIADAKAPGQNRPIIESTANNLPIVQITAPSVAGVSRNFYQQFNVDPRGLILNNSGIITQTQLAGYITGNPFLGKGPGAKIILNEVTGNNPSYLRGYTEVAGQKAEVIIANPSGIYGDGFGFINTSRVVLTTGSPVFGGSGSLDAFQVTGGQINIQGAGLDAKNLDQVDLISRTVAINAGVWAKNLNVVAGTNKVDYNTLHTQNIAGDANASQVAIDIGQLGGMYAQKIYLVGTENGVGVNSKGTIAAGAGDLIITNAGKVVLAGNTSATGNLNIAATGDIVNQNTLYAQGNTKITTQGVLENSGTILAGQQTTVGAQRIISTGTMGAGVQTDGTLGNVGDLTINATGTILARGSNMAAGNLTLHGTGIDLVGSKNDAGGNAILTATNGDINHTGAALQARTAIILASGAVHNDKDGAGKAATIQAGFVAINGASISNIGSEITQTGTGDTHISATTTINNTGGQIATNAKNLIIEGDTLNNSQGKVTHAGDGVLTVTTNNGVANASGSVITKGNLKITASALTSDQGKLIASGAVNINLKNELQNQGGIVEAGQGLTVNAQEISNKSGILTSLDGSGLTITTSQDIDNTSGTIGSNGDINLIARNLNNQKGKILGQGAINATLIQNMDNLDGSLAAQKNILVKASSMNGGGKATAGQDLNIAVTGSFHQLAGGEFHANRDVTILADDFASQGSISAGGNIKVNANNISNNKDGELASGASLTIISTGDISNSGRIEGNGVSINGENITNAGTVVSRGNTIITGQTVKSSGIIGSGINTDGSVGTSGDLMITASGAVSATGKNLAGGNLTVTGTAVDQSGAITYAGGDAKITAQNGDINHTGAALQARTAIILASGTVHNDKDGTGKGANIQAGLVAIHGSSISNMGSKITQTGTGDTHISATTAINNSSGEITTNAKNLIIEGDTLNNSQGKLIASGTVNIHLKNELQNQGGIVEAGQGLTVNAQEISNKSGILTSLDGSGLTINIGQDIDNTSGTIGGNGDVNLTARNLNNQKGKILGQGAINATLIQHMDNLDGSLTAQKNIVVKASSMNGGGKATAGQDLNIAVTGSFHQLAGGEFHANRDVTILADDFASQGSISAGGNIKVNANNISNNKDGELASGASLTMISTGDINNSGGIEGNGVSINGENITNAGTVVSRENTIITGQTVKSSGVIGSGINTDGSVGTSGDLTIAASGAVSATGKNLAGGNLTVIGTAVDQSGAITYAGGDAKITATNGDINHTGAALQARTAIILASGAVHNDKDGAGKGANIQAGLVTINGSSISNMGSKITQTGTGDTHISATTAINNSSGEIATNAKNLIIEGDTLNNSQGKLIASGGANINLKNELQNQDGIVEAGQGLTVNAQEISNKSGSLTSLDGNGLTINARQNIDNTSGTIGGNGDINLTAQNLNNQKGKIQGQGAINATLIQNMNNLDGSLAAQKNILVKASSMNGGGKATAGQDLNIAVTGGFHQLAGGEFHANRDVTILADDFASQGSISAGGNIKVNANNISNNKDGELASGASLTMISTGDISNSGSIEGNGVSINGENITNAGTVVSRGNTVITGQTVKSSGVIGSGINTDGSVGTSGDLMITARGAVSATGKNLAGGNLTVTGTAVDQSGAITYAGGDAKIIATNGDVDHTGAALQAKGAVIISATDTVKNDKNANGKAGQILANSLAITAKNISNKGGSIQQTGSNTTKLIAENSIDNTNGIIATNGQASIQAQNIDNVHGTITTQQQMDITATSLTNRQGTISSNGNSVTIGVQGEVTNTEQGLIQGNKGLLITAHALNNQSGYIQNIDGTDLKLAINQEIQNQGGLIGGNGNVNISGQSLANQGGQVVAQKSLTIATEQGIDNASGKLFAKQDLNINIADDSRVNFTNSNGSIHAGQDLAIQLNGDLTNGLGGELKADRNLTLNANGKVTNQGSIVAVQNLSVSGSDIINDAGATTAANGALNLIATGNIVNNGKLHGSAMNISGQKFNNSGTVLADSLTVQAKNISNSTGALMNTTGDMNLGTANDKAGNVTNQGTVYAQGNTNVTTTGVLTNSGMLLASKNTTVTAQSVSSSGTLGAGINSNGTIGDAGDLSIITTGAVMATGKNLAGGNLAITATSVDQSGGVTTVGGGATITATSGDVDHTGASLQANGEVIIKASGAVKNDKNTKGIAGQILGGHVVIAANNISNKSGIILQTGGDVTNLKTANSIDNTGGKIATNGELQINAKGNITNQGGSIITKNQAVIQSQGNIDNSNKGSINVGGDLKVTTQSDVINTNGTIESANGIMLKGKNISNTGGKIANTGSATSLTIDVTNKLNNQAGFIGSNGNLVIGAGSVDNANNTMAVQGDLALTINGDFTNQGNLETKGALSINATNINNSALGTINSNKTSITAGGNISNAGRIEGNQVTTTSQNMTNTGAVIGNTVTVNASNFNNQGQKALVAATESVNLWVANTLTNQDGATIISLGDLNIAANGKMDANGLLVNRTAQVTNTAATIEVENNLNLAAEQVVNNADQVLVETMTTSSNQVLIQKPWISSWNVKGSIGYDFGSGHGGYANPFGTTAWKLCVTVPKKDVISYDKNQKEIIFSDSDISTYQVVARIFGWGHYAETTPQYINGPITYRGKIAGQTTAYCSSVSQTSNGDYYIEYYPAYNPKLHLNPDTVRSISTDRSSDAQEVNRTTNATVTQEYITNKPNIGQMTVGHNLNLNIGQQFQNQYSTVTVGDTVKGYIGTLQNEGYRLRRTTKAIVYTKYYAPYGAGGTWADIHDGPFETVDYSDGGLPGIFTAKNILITGHNVENIERRPDGTLPLPIGSTDKPKAPISIPVVRIDTPEIKIHETNDISVTMGLEVGGKRVLTTDTSVPQTETTVAKMVTKQPDALVSTETGIGGKLGDIVNNTNSNPITTTTIKPTDVSTPTGNGIITTIAPLGSTVVNTNNNPITATTIKPTDVSTPTGTVITTTVAPIGSTVVNTSNNPITTTTIKSTDVSPPIEKGITTTIAPLVPTVANTSSTPVSPKLISRQTVDFTIVGNTGHALLAIPQNGLYKTHSEPTAKYVVETDPRFANYRTFSSSDYMLEKVKTDPEKVHKRLGDGFYEQKLVNEQISQLTGRKYLTGYDNTEAEFKALMDNGIAAAKNFDLVPGIALTSMQVANLTKDLVWMVEQRVTMPDGTMQKVLVPQVYVSQANTMKLTTSGALIVADKIDMRLSGNLDNSGTITGNFSADIHATNITNRSDGLITSNGTISLVAANDIVNQSATISGKQVLIFAGGDVINETTTREIAESLGGTNLGYTWAGINTVIGQKASIQASGDLTVVAGRDIFVKGGDVVASGNTLINAGRNLSVDTVVAESHFTDIGKTSRYERSSVTNVISSIQGGNNVTLTSKGDITLTGVQVSAKNDLSIGAQGNLMINATKDAYSDDQEAGDKKQYHARSSYDEMTIESGLRAGNNVTITAGPIATNQLVINTNRSNGIVNIEGSNISSDKGIVKIIADKDITVKSTTERHETSKADRVNSGSFLSSTSTEKRDFTAVNQVKGSTISGDQVTISSGKDLTVQGSSVVGTNDVTLKATENVNIISAKETGKDEHFSQTTTSGLFSGGGFGFTIGSKSEKITNNEQTLAEIGSTIGSVTGNVSIAAGDKVTSAGTNITAAKDVTITGKDVTIDNTVNTVDSQYKYEFKQTGLTVSLGGGIVDTATSALSNINRSQNVQDSRLQALYEYKALQNIKDLDKYKGNLKNGLGISVSFGSTQMTSEQITHTETVNVSNIDAGGKVNIKATTGDVNLQGTNINATDITLDAKNNINIDSGENKQQTDSKNSSSSWSVGGTIGTGFFGNFSKGSGNENGNATTHTGSLINASGTLTLTSGNDTSITGSKAKGDKVVANIGGDLNIASVQDTDDYTAKNQSSGFGISTKQVDGKPLDPGTMGPINQVTSVGFTGSYNKGKTDSNYASVTDQAGIYAGKDGFNITVGKNTDLKGAVIASTASPDKNKLSTDTLTYSDIQNHAEYDSSSTGVNLNTKTDAKLNEQGLTPIVGVPASGDADSTTKSAISPGTIDIRSNPNIDLSKLSRDTTNSLNVLGKIFDKKTVKEQQELAGLFGELAFEEVHKLSEKNGWDEGSPQKIALHALVGGIMSELAGSGFAAGAKGAGFNEALQKELSKIKDPALHQWASYIIGSAVAGTVGGATATSGTKNNVLAYISFTKQLKTKIENLLGKKVGSEVYAQIDEALLDLPNSTSDEIPNKKEDVDASEKIRDVLNKNKIEGDTADQIVSYYLQKVDETHSILDPIYQQGRKAGLDMLVNGVMIVTGAAELKALYQAGKITIQMYFFGLRYGPAITAEEFALPKVVVIGNRLSKTGNDVGAMKAHISGQLENTSLYKMPDGTYKMLIGDGNKAYTLTESQVNELSTLNLNKWASGSIGNSAESLVEHFMKHGAEVGAKSITQYLNKAEGFMQNLRGARPYPIPGSTEGVYRYVKNGKYIDLAPDKTIISFGLR